MDPQNSHLSTTEFPSLHRIPFSPQNSLLSTFPSLHPGAPSPSASSPKLVPDSLGRLQGRPARGSSIPPPQAGEPGLDLDLDLASNTPGSAHAELSPPIQGLIQSPRLLPLAAPSLLAALLDRHRFTPSLPAPGILSRGKTGNGLSTALPPAHPAWKCGFSAPAALFLPHSHLEYREELRSG